MGKIIKVREVGDPVLNKMSKEVDITNINSDVLDIIDDLKATLEDGVGVGYCCTTDWYYKKNYSS